MVNQIKNEANPIIKKVIARRFKTLKTSGLFQIMKIINPAQEVIENKNTIKLTV